MSTYAQKYIASLEVRITMRKEHAVRALEELRDHLRIDGESRTFVLQRRLQAVSTAVEEVGRWSDELAELRSGKPAKKPTRKSADQLIPLGRI
jgi:hypothetical protein